MNNAKIMLKLPEEIQEIFEKRVSSKIRNEDRLLQIFELSPPELTLAMAYSNWIFKRFNDGVITFSKNIFLPLTSFCRNKCSYCNFRNDNEELTIYRGSDCHHP